MLIKNALKLAGVTLAFAITSSLSAAPINVTVDSTGALLHGVGLADSDQYVPNNNNPASNLSFLQTEVGYYNGAFNPDLPTPVGPAAAASEDDINTSLYDAISGYDYVVFHFGAGQATYLDPVSGKWVKSQGGYWSAWYLGGIGASFTVPQLIGQDGKWHSVGGFSSARYYNPHTSEVPDGGATIALLGAGVLLVGALRRRSA